MLAHTSGEHHSTGFSDNVLRLGFDIALSDGSRDIYRSGDLTHAQLSWHAEERDRIDTSLATRRVYPSHGTVCKMGSCLPGGGLVARLFHRVGDGLLERHHPTLPPRLLPRLLVHARAYVGDAGISLGEPVGVSRYALCFV